MAQGGAAIPDNGIPAIWEPFLQIYKGKIIIHYSDQRDPLYGQKLVYQTSRDLIYWGPVVGKYLAVRRSAGLPFNYIVTSANASSRITDDVAYSIYTDRPGMTTVTQLPNGKYIMTYEFGGGPLANASDTGYEFPVYYRINDSPLDFKSSIGLPLITDTGIQPTSSPYVTWTPVGGPNGTVIVSCGTLSQVFINQELGDVNAWKSVPTPEGVSCGFTHSS